MNRQAVASLSPKVAVVVVVGIIYLLVYFFVLPGDTPVSPPVPAINKSPGAPAAPAVAVQSQAGEERGRLNPFDVPAVFLTSQQKEEVQSSEQGQPIVAGRGGYGAGRSAADFVRPPARLTGVTVTGVASGDDGVKLAVLSDGKQAKAYRPGETVNGYRIEAVTGNAVIFNGPAGREILPLATQVSNVVKSNPEERSGMKNDTTQTVAH